MDTYTAFAPEIAISTAPFCNQPLIELALQISADTGFPVFPLGARKRPCIPKDEDGGHGHLDATTDPDRIRLLFGRPTAKLVGVPTGELTGFDVLEIDARNGGDTWELGHVLPSTRTHLSPSGGRHYVFRHAPGIRNSASRIAPGVDVRGQGGYVGYPPSGAYTIEYDGPLADWPDWLLPLALPKPTDHERPVSPGSAATISDKRLEGLRRTALDKIASAPDGRKHEVLRDNARLLGGIQDRAGFSDADAVQWIMDALPDTVEDWEGAKRTALWALKEGRKKPLDIADRPYSKANGKTPPPPPPHDDAGPEPEPEPSAAETDPEKELDLTTDRLAKLSAAQYELVRVDEAKRLKVRPTVLDALVKAKRPAPPPPADDDRQGHKLELSVAEAWPDDVDGAALLADLCKFFAQYAFLPNGAATALSLWTVHTYAFEVFRHTPRLHIKAIAKNSGKTTVLDLLELVVCRALPAAHATSAVLFRAIEMVKPTLLIDEADTFLADAEEVRGVLNAGHKAGGQVLRAVGEDFEPRAFRVFSPVAIAGIGNLPGTIADRAIAISMKRAMKSELPAPIGADARTEAGRLASCIVRWTADHRPRLAAANPDMGEMFNRLADNWRPLYAIADLAGGIWPERVQGTATALAVTDDDAETLAIKLLADIKTTFAVAGTTAGTDTTITSKELTDGLVAMESRPWAELGRAAKPLTQNRMARMLKPFGIVPGQIGAETERKRGYALSRFLDAFARHCP